MRTLALGLFVGYFAGLAAAKHGLLIFLEGAFVGAGVAALLWNAHRFVGWLRDFSSRRRRGVNGWH